MKSKSLARLASATLLAAIASGCFSVSPYDYSENWIIREDPVRPFTIPADVFYVQSTLYESVSLVPMMDSYAKAEVGKKRFAGLARVFSPLVATQEDLDKAVDWYFDNDHTWGRPVVFIGEGEGGKLLRHYEEDHDYWLKKRGLVASFYTEEAHKGFVTSEMVDQIREAVARARYQDVWGREMPDQMLK